MLLPALRFPYLSCLPFCSQKRATDDRELNILAGSEAREAETEKWSDREAEKIKDERLCEIQRARPPGKE